MAGWPCYSARFGQHRAAPTTLGPGKEYGNSPRPWKTDRFEGYPTKGVAILVCEIGKAATADLARPSAEASSLKNGFCACISD
jgi:hypothetical protein